MVLSAVVGRQRRSVVAKQMYWDGGGRGQGRELAGCVQEK